MEELKLAASRRRSLLLHLAARSFARELQQQQVAQQVSWSARSLACFLFRRSKEARRPMEMQRRGRLAGRNLILLVSGRFLLVVVASTAASQQRQMRISLQPPQQSASLPSFALHLRQPGWSGRPGASAIHHPVPNGSQCVVLAARRSLSSRFERGRPSEMTTVRAL